MTQENPIWMQNKGYSARLDRQIIAALWSEGVLTGLVVTQRGAGANMSVDIGVGTAVIAGDDQANQGSYLVSTTAAENLAIAAAPGSNSRRDLIYYRVNDPNATGPAGDNSVFGVVTGTAAASPTLPALPTTAIPLAEVLVASGTVSITNAMVTGLRTSAQMKGGMRPGTITAYAGPEAKITADSSVFLCNGQAVSRTTELALFNEIGTIWGSGDNTTTFNVPDLRGVVLAGADNMGGTPANRLTGATVVGTLLSTETVALASANNGPHTHTVANHTHSIDHDHGSVNTGAQSSDHTHGFSATTADAGSHQHYVGGYNYDGSGATGNTKAILSDDGYNFYGQVSYAVSVAGNHNHTVSGNTGNMSVGHTHAVDLPNLTGTSGGATPATDSSGSGTPFSRVQPTRIINYMIKR